MKKRNIIIGSILFILLLAGGLFVFLKKSAPAEPPEIRVTVAGKEIPCELGKNKWKGAVYDRLDVLYAFLRDYSENDISQFQYGDTVEIEFLGKEPETFKLFEESVNVGGDLINPDDRKEIPIELKDHKASFVLSEDTRTNDEIEKLHGFRLMCCWGENSCEYGFVICIAK